MRERLYRGIITLFKGELLYWLIILGIAGITYLITSL